MTLITAEIKHQLACAQEEYEWIKRAIANGIEDSKSLFTLYFPLFTRHDFVFASDSDDLDDYAMMIHTVCKKSEACEREADIFNQLMEMEDKIVVKIMEMEIFLAVEMDV